MLKGVGIIGAGGTSNYHIDALRRIVFTEVRAIYDINYELALEKAGKFDIPIVYKNMDEILQDKNIISIHDCTYPTAHTEINKKIIESGKHVLSEKPLSVSSSECEGLLELLEKNPDIVAGVNFNYRMNALVQEMKIKIKMVIWENLYCAWYIAAGGSLSIPGTCHTILTKAAR